MDAAPRATLPLALLLLACAPRVAPDLAADPERLLAEVRAAQAKVTRVRGTARVRIESPGASGTLLELVAAEKPGRLRLETLDFFGNPAAVLVADGDRFGFYDARARTWYRGPATPENVSRFLPVVLPPEELVTILCGSAPILPGRAVEARPHGALVRLVVARGEVGQQLEVGARLAIASSRVRRAAADGAAQEVFYDVELLDPADLGGVLFPRVVTLDAPGARSRVRLEWGEDLEVNGPPAPGLFSLEPPRGAKVVELPAGEAPPEVELPFRE